MWWGQVQRGACRARAAARASSCNRRSARRCWVFVASVKSLCNMLQQRRPTPAHKLWPASHSHLHSYGRRRTCCCCCSRACARSSAAVAAVCCAAAASAAASCATAAVHSCLCSRQQCSQQHRPHTQALTMPGSSTFAHGKPRNALLCWCRTAGSTRAGLSCACMRRAPPARARCRARLARRSAARSMLAARPSAAAPPARTTSMHASCGGSAACDCLMRATASCELQRRRHAPRTAAPL